MENRIGQTFEIGNDVYKVIDRVGEYWQLMSASTGVMEDGVLKKEEELLALKRILLK